VVDKKTDEVWEEPKQDKKRETFGYTGYLLWLW
jgi:hypothetical protein